jgi:ParB family chromosome partitioning protein
MKIKLSEIKAATPRVRKELNLDKLDELAESIKETGGVIVPVKVRKNGEGYTTVYGHRRIEATRLAGFDEIEAFIEDVDDDEILTQALIENVVREDMTPIDVAKALKQVQDDTGMSQRQMAAYLGMPSGTIGEYMALLKPAFEKVVERLPGKQVGIGHLREAKAGTEDDADAVKILEKAAEEGLTKKQTRRVADEFTSAKEKIGPERAKKQVLEPKYEDIKFDPAAEFLRTAKKKKKPTAREVEGKILFQWIRDERVIVAEEGLKAISACVAAINMSGEDRPGGKIVLQKLLNRTQVVAEQIQDVLDEYD